MNRSRVLFNIAVASSVFVFSGCMSGEVSKKLKAAFTPCSNPSGDLSSKEPDSMTALELRAELRRQGNPASEPGAIMFGVMHVAIIIVCVILMHRTARATKYSRFLVHLAYSYTITGVFYLIATLMPFLKGFLVSTIGVLDNANEEQMRGLVVELRDIGFMWKALDSFLSLFSSFYLLTAWHLLHRYPKKDTVDRKFYFVLNLLFVAIVAPILVQVLVARSKNPIFILLDSIIAGAAMILFGIELWRRLRPQVDALARMWPYLSAPLLVFYGLWGVAQPVYYHFKECPMSHWYFGSLLVLKFLCGLSAVITSLMCLEERERFKS